MAHVIKQETSHLQEEKNPDGTHGIESSKDTPKEIFG